MFELEAHLLQKVTNECISAELAFLTWELRVAVGFATNTPPIQIARRHNNDGRYSSMPQAIRAFEPILPILSDFAIKFKRLCDFPEVMRESSAGAGRWRPLRHEKSLISHLRSFT